MKKQAKAPYVPSPSDLTDEVERSLKSNRNIEESISKEETADENLDNTRRRPKVIPPNWDKDFCKMPLCDVTRTCPEHIFKGQNNPAVGPPKETPAATPVPTPTTSRGVNCK